MTPPEHRDPNTCALHDLIQQNKSSKFQDHEERLNKLEEGKIEMDKFKNWWDVEEIGTLIRENNRAVKGIATTHKALLAVMSLAGTGWGVYEAVHHWLGVHP